jgi:3-phosphoshikimate 1-carboxyvinyltransferase
MSLFVAGLRMRSANLFSGAAGVCLSFPGFLAEFARAGVRTSLVDAGAEAVPLDRHLHPNAGASHLV